MADDPVVVAFNALLMELAVVIGADGVERVVDAYQTAVIDAADGGGQ